MSDEMKLIEPTFGAYKGQRLQMSTADADVAVSEGWAVDPFAVRDPNAPEPKPLSDDERLALVEKANKGLRKLRGEDENQTTKQAAAHTEAHTRDMAAEEPHSYKRK